MEEQPRIDPAQVLGWGVDADPRNDPTYPMRDSSREERALGWPRPTLQLDSVEVLQSTEHNRRTAVFGTSTPPSGVSGAIRRQAFTASEGKWSHWLLLLLADRINVVEGVLDDVAKGKAPNIPREMGIASELQYNVPGLIRKTILTGAALTASAALIYWALADKKHGGNRAMSAPATPVRRVE